MNEEQYKLLMEKINEQLELLREGKIDINTYMKNLQNYRDIFDKFLKGEISGEDFMKYLNASQNVTDLFTNEVINEPDYNTTNDILNNSFENGITVKRITYHKQ